MSENEKPKNFLQLYVICHRFDDALRGPIKVGISQSAKERLGTLQVGNPHKLALYEYWRLPDSIAKNFEKMFHHVASQIGGTWLSGEWHAMMPDDACEYIEMGFQAFWHHCKNINIYTAPLEKPYHGALRGRHG